MIFALVVFPIVFFILGFVFKLVRPHYTPIEFVLVNIVLSMLTLMLSFGAAQKQQLEMNVEQWIGSKLGKEYVKDIYCHPTYLASMRSTSCKILG